MIFPFVVVLLLAQACAGKHYLVELENKTNPEQELKAKTRQVLPIHRHPFKAHIKKDQLLPSYQYQYHQYQILIRQEI